MPRWRVISETEIPEYWFEGRSEFEDAIYVVVENVETGEQLDFAIPKKEYSKEAVMKKIKEELAKRKKEEKLKGEEFEV